MHPLIGILSVMACYRQLTAFQEVGIPPKRPTWIVE